MRLYNTVNLMLDVMINIIGLIDISDTFQTLAMFWRNKYYLILLLLK